MNARETPARRVGIAIVGAGFAGLGMAIRLKQSGRDDFFILERADAVGGTWRDNSYPGCACDVESPLYSFSFAPNPSWSRMFSPQPEIQLYLRDCVASFGLQEHLKLQTDVQSATWDAAERSWRLATSRGVILAKVLIAAMGPLSEPSVPKLPGLAGFRGRSFHSARWDHSFDFSGKRIAVVGTGASAIQFVPRLQPLVEKLTLYQRTPAWVVPRFDRPFSERERQWFRAAPIVLRLRRWGLYWLREIYGLTFRHPWLMRWTRRIALNHLTKAVASSDLRTKLTPNYSVGCKRVLISNDYYPALVAPNVEVVAAGLREVRENSVIGDDGVERPVDAIVFGTGFHVTDLPRGDAVRGRGGVSLEETWRGSPRAFLGTTVSGFPNLFVLLGPNTGLGHSSVVLMIEAQIGHVLSVLKHMRKGGLATVEPQPEAQAAFNAEVAAQSRGTVWLSGGCKSWYLDSANYNSVLWPRSVIAFRRRLRRFDPRDFLFTK